ncbi:ABC transporter ATP-binding protein [Roseovarius nubinhibens]|uniref:Glutathione ABC transporter ATP-binding protein GsiA n=1 Tax=Roseovarius nubinhibens TaxID=314263 RepID=A0A348WBA6_9RHOB|nr:glutathione ABC transporter ATP-binding protein GsiA [Roseovarius nubinhibens]|tara:strand:+ start:11928 stop:13673 length:1746 start_codon:yes stop_codon:yes gene_type:complete
MQVPPLLSVKDLHVSFGKVKAVRGISFDVQPGEVVCIVGESGSGKSVTARALMGLLEDGAVSSGEILLRGSPIKNDDSPRMNRIRGRDIAMIFQEPLTALNPAMRVGHQIAEMILNHTDVSRRDAQAQAVSLLDRVGIRDAKERANAYPHELSGGMRQRVMIACACAANPGLIIADEPTTALDVTIQAQVLDLLFKMQRDLGSSLLFVTHDLGVVAEIADRVVVLYKGELIEQGPVEKIFSAADHPYTRALIKAAPDINLPRSPLRRFPSVDTEAIFNPPSDDTKKKQRPPARAKHSHAMDRTRPLDLPALLEVRDLRRSFTLGRGLLKGPRRKLHAVDGVSLTIARGTTTALIGESGSGKTTLGRCIAQLDRPTSGSTYFAGQDTTVLRGAPLLRFRRHVQTIFQDPYASLNPRRPIGEAITDGLAIHGLADQKERDTRARGLLQRVGLSPEDALRYPHQFSGGQRQRIAIARALALDPEFIIADEAVSALDVSVRAQVLNLLIELQEERGLSFLFITHDLSTVRQFANRIAIMQNGRIVEEAPTEEIFTSPRHPYTRDLLSAVPRLFPDPGTRLRQRYL